MAQHDERAAVDGQERESCKGGALIADCPFVAITFQLDPVLVQRPRHVGEQQVDRGLGGAVGKHLLAGEPDLMGLGAALDDSGAEAHHVEQFDTGGDREGLGGRRAQPVGVRSRCPRGEPQVVGVR